MNTWINAIAKARRPKWRPDDCVECERCQRSFSSMRWKHHCRNCGGMFCDMCAPAEAQRPLPHLGYLEPVRVCRRCASVSGVSPTAPSPSSGPTYPVYPDAREACRTETPVNAEYKPTSSPRQAAPGLYGAAPPPSAAPGSNSYQPQPLQPRATNSVRKEVRKASAHAERLQERLARYKEQRGRA